MRRLACITVLVAAAAVLLPGVSTAAPSAQDTAAQPATFGIRTSSATAPDNRGRFMFGATPGAVMQDHVAITNVSQQPLTLRLYAADAFNTREGGFDLLAAGKPSTDVGSWVKLSTDSVTLPPDGQQIVPFTVTVPSDAAPGDHAAGVVASLLTEKTDGDGNKVAVDTRVGTRIYLRVAGELRPQLSVQNVESVYEHNLIPFAPGDATITYTVRNNGNVRLEGGQSVRVDLPWGSSVDAAQLPKLPELLPGNEITMTARVEGVFPAVLLGSVIRLEPSAMPGDVNPPASPSELEDSFTAIPWTGLGAIVLLVALLLLLRWRRRRTAGPRAPEQRSPVGAAA